MIRSGGAAQLGQWTADRLGTWWAAHQVRTEEPAALGRPDLRLVPIAAAGWAAAWIGTAPTPRTWVAVAVTGLALSAAARWRRSAWLLGTALMVLVLAGLGGVQSHRLSSGPLASMAEQEAAVALELYVRGDPRMHPAEGTQPAYVTAEMTAVVLSGRGTSWRLRAPVLVVAGGASADSVRGLVVGSRIRLSGRLQAPDRGSALAAVLRARSPAELVAGPSPSAAAVERVREGLRQSVAERRPEPRALVPALVLGDTSAVPPELVADFQSTGLTHLTAVSGANLTLLLAFVLLAARWLGVRGWWLRLIGLAGVAVFVALCRTEPSVLRAAAMGLVALAALGSGGRRAGLRNLSVAMIALLLIDPFLSRSLGFALSVLASGGIIWWARAWAVTMNRWLPMAIAEMVAVPLSAHLTTLPVVAAISGQVSASGLLANAVAGPFVGPATVFGFAAAGASQLSATAAEVLAFGAAWSAQLIIWVAHAGARLPGSSWPWPVTPAALVWLGVVALGVGLALPYVLARRWLSLLIAVVMVVGLATAPTQPGWPPRGWVLVACDIGQGDGLVLRAANHQAVVVDAGPDPKAMARCLDQLAVTAIPLLILTHFHADHVDGLSAVWGRRQVGRIWVSPLAAPAHEVTAVHRLAAEHGTPVSSPALGERLQLGGVSCTVIGPVAHPGEELGESSVANDASLVVMATVSGLRILLTGDVEPPGQRAIMATGADLHADVLKIPHHGSARQEPGFFAATGARVAIASAGVDNDYGHPAPRTVQLAQSLGMTVLHTDRDGGVAVSTREGALAVITQR